jgi:hypothetical protein
VSLLLDTSACLCVALFLILTRSVLTARCHTPCLPSVHLSRSDKSQVDWVKAFIGALEELRKYIMQFHTTALTWNPKVRLRLAWIVFAKASS